MLAEVVAVGDVMVDVELDELVPGQRRHAGVAIQAGGSAVNAARAARPVATAAVIGRTGDDAAAELIAAELAGAGIAAHLARDPTAPTGTVVFARAQQAATADRGANASFAAADLPAPLAARAVLVSGYLLFASGSTAGARAALAAADAEWLAVDAGLSSLVSALSVDELAAATAPANIVFADAETARAVTGAAPAEAAAALGRRYAVAVVTADADGAFVASEEGVLAVRPRVRLPESRAGAGDAFAGAFLAALVRGADVRSAAEAAADRATRLLVG